MRAAQKAGSKLRSSERGRISTAMLNQMTVIIEANGATTKIEMSTRVSLRLR
jgi:hypothetical protein